MRRWTPCPLAYYFSEPVVCNDAKGVGPLVLAYTEMIAR